MSAARLSTRNVAAAVIGNALEFYDFITYAFFAVQIGRVFFPSHDEYVSLMASLGTFGVGFVMRPVGGIVIGRFADRAGRKPAMILSLSLMGGAILAVAVVPSYAVLGALAPALVVIARMAQGFALGGQVGSTTAFLMEAAPLRERGFYTALQGGSQYASSVAAGTIGVILSLFMSPGALEAYGWRVAFALGAIALPLGLFLIRTVPETLHQSEDSAVPAARAETDWALWLGHRRVIVLGLVILASATIFTYITNYMTTYAESVLHMGSTVSLGATVVGGIAGIAGTQLGGWLSDRLGRWPIMVWPRVAYVVVVWPLYSWMANAHSAAALLSTSAALVFLGTLSFGPFWSALAESLPKRIRGSSFGTVYAVSIAAFGGTAQPIVTWLLHLTGNALAPAWYLIASGICGIIASALMLETAPVRVGFAPAPAE